MDFKRIRQLYNYNPSKGIIKEDYGDINTSDYICIGEVDGYFPWSNSEGKNKVYIMASPQKVLKYGKEMYDIRYTENNDGSGRQTDIMPSRNKEMVVIYPEHEDDEYGEIFLGKKKDKELLARFNHYT